MRHTMRYVRALAAAAMVMTFMAVSSPPARAADVSFDFFYSNLSPHGSWLVSGQYGRCWRPQVYTAQWNPYYDGHWVYTDVGWTWVSDYEWGAIPYHYGTWVADPQLGWVWVPGYVWAPAWVVFRTGPDYIGWAPVQPGYSVDASFSFGARASGPFVFVSTNNFLAPRVRSYVVPEGRTRVIIRNTRVVNSLTVENNIIVNRGPDRTIVERATGRSIREVPIERVNRVAPGPRVERSRLAVDPQHGLKAAEPVRQETPLPPSGRRERASVGKQTSPRSEGPVVRGRATRPSGGSASVEQPRSPRPGSTVTTDDTKKKQVRREQPARKKGQKQQRRPGEK